MSALADGDRSNSRSRLDRNARRLRQIVSVAVRYGLSKQLRRLPGRHIQRWLRGSAGQDLMELAAPVRLRLALTELGTTFIKFGQMLSMRADLVGQDVARELTHLQSEASPDPPAAAEATVEKELGAAPEAVFASFDPKPFASASIAQVHYARLHTGENVVVKIQRDGIERQIDTDLAILADLAALAEKHVGELRLYHPVAVAREFARMMRGELDFRRELRNIEQFQRNFAGDPTVHFPVPFPDYCTHRVLTMERLDGALLSQIRLPGPNPEMDEFVRRGANVYLEMIFRDSFYHADPHPGNLMVLADQVVGVLDCGMVLSLDEDLRERVEDVLLAFVRKDAPAMTDAVWELCTEPPSGGRQRLQADVADLVADYAGDTVSGLDLGAMLNRLAEIIHHNHLFLPPGASLLLRMLAQLEGTAKQLNPSFELTALLEPYAERAVSGRLAPMRLWQKLRRGVREWDRLASAVPGDLSDLLRRMRAGTLSVHLEHRRLDPVVNRLVLGLLTSSLLLGSSLLWSMHAEPLVKGVSLFGAIGYALAFVMGVTLLGRIRRSERPREDR
jgi:ubiquinone biosynthesis protein